MLFKMACTVLKSLFSKPATVAYPAKPIPYPAATRGQIDNQINVCIFCGLCQRKCPTHAITVDRTARTWQINHLQCIQCSSCVEACPKKCLTQRQMSADVVAQKSEAIICLQGPPAPPKPAPANPAPAAAPKQN